MNHLAYLRCANLSTGNCGGLPASSTALFSVVKLQPCFTEAALPPAFKLVQVISTASGIDLLDNFKKEVVIYATMTIQPHGVYGTFMVALPSGRSEQPPMVSPAIFYVDRLPNIDPTAGAVCYNVDSTGHRL